MEKNHLKSIHLLHLYAEELNTEEDLARWDDTLGHRMSYKWPRFEAPVDPFADQKMHEVEDLEEEPKEGQKGPPKRGQSPAGKEKGQQRRGTGVEADKRETPPEPHEAATMALPFLEATASFQLEVQAQMVDVGGSSSPKPPPTGASSAQKRAVALFEYASQGADYLALQEGEALTVMGEDQDGWIRAVNSAGIEGWVPFTYLQFT